MRAIRDCRRCVQLNQEHRFHSFPARRLMAGKKAIDCSRPEAPNMSKLFISHSSQDDAFVRDLRATLSDHGQDGWIDSRELHGGDPLWPEIQKAIDEASGYAVVVSPDGLQSKWVGKELRHALALRDERGKEKFPVIPLSLN